MAQNWKYVLAGAVAIPAFVLVNTSLSLAQVQLTSPSLPFETNKDVRELSKGKIEDLLNSSTNVQIVPIIKNSKLGNNEKLSDLLKNLDSPYKGTDLGRAKSTNFTHLAIDAVRTSPDTTDLGVFSYNSAIKFYEKGKSDKPAVMIVCKFCGTAIFAHVNDSNSAVEVSDPIKIDSLDHLLSALLGSVSKGTQPAQSHGCAGPAQLAGPIKAPTWLIWDRRTLGEQGCSRNCPARDLRPDCGVRSRTRSAGTSYE